ncbi:MAG: alanine racemase [Candidatus Hydrogenedentes bacterium]|nr:alanine racemase [Candidatus Hydrogenedentota bacterium]
MSSLAPSRAIISLSAYAHNLGIVKEMIPNSCRILAVVKADAYGHGAVQIARAAVSQGASMLGVATVSEGVELREAGIETPILVMVQITDDQIGAVIEHGLRLTISDADTAERVGDQARRANKVVPVHCKVDTGMGRQGFWLDTAAAEMLFLTRISNIDIEAICTHFPVADSSREPFTSNQVRALKQLLKQLEKEGIPYNIVHAANSSAVVNHPNSVFDMVRPGLMTYGVWPTDSPPAVSPLRPVLRWETRVVLVKRLDAGASIGYGRTYTTRDRARVGVLPVGYADGYKYGLSNRADVLIRGKRCPVRGTISMDQTVVDLSEVPEAALGDTAILIGADGNDAITAAELAVHAQTIPYDILTGIGRRVTREYVE